MALVDAVVEGSSASSPCASWLCNLPASLGTMLCPRAQWASASSAASALLQSMPSSSMGLNG